MLQVLVSLFALHYFINRLLNQVSIFKYIMVLFFGVLLLHATFTNIELPSELSKINLSFIISCSLIVYSLLILIDTARNLFTYVLSMFKNHYTENLALQFMKTSSIIFLVTYIQAITFKILIYIGVLVITHEIRFGNLNFVLFKITVINDMIQNSISGVARHFIIDDLLLLLLGLILSIIPILKVNNLIPNKILVTIKLISLILCGMLTVHLSLTLNSTLLLIAFTSMLIAIGCIGYSIHNRNFQAILQLK